MLARHCPDTRRHAVHDRQVHHCSTASTVHVSRSGYTGEDGFEISVKAKRLEQVADALLAEPEVKPIGLGARDSLRLEAGLCLYGHDIDTTTSPVEAALVWSMQKRRREEGGFPGADRIQRELAEGPARMRVGLLPEGRAPAREGTVDDHARRPRRSASSRRAASAPASTARSPWAMSRPAHCRRRHGTGIAWSAARRCPPASCRHALRAPPLSRKPA